METVAYLQHFIGALHDEYAKALGDLTTEQLHYRPSATTNHIAFTAWHWVRTEDNIVNFVLQRASTVWLAEGLDQKWALPRVAQGTGMAQTDAYALTVPSAAEFMDYAQKVWASTAPYIAALTSNEWSRIVKVQPFGEIPVLQVLGQTLIAHGNQHLGEVWLTRELQGLTGIGF